MNVLIEITSNILIIQLECENAKTKHVHIITSSNIISP